MYRRDVIRVSIKSLVIVSLSGKGGNADFYSFRSLCFLADD